MYNPVVHLPSPEEVLERDEDDETADGYHGVVHVEGSDGMGLNVSRSIVDERKEADSQLAR